MGKELVGARRELIELRGMVQRAVDKAQGIVARTGSPEARAVRDALAAQHRVVGTLIEPAAA